MMRARGPTGVGIRKPRYSTQCMPAPVVYRTELKGLERLHEGKVRDIYAVDEQTLLIVTTDRLSAFDVVLPDPLPDKARGLTRTPNSWCPRTRSRRCRSPPPPSRASWRAATRRQPSPQPWSHGTAYR